MMDSCPTINWRHCLFNSSKKHSNSLSSPMQTVGIDDILSSAEESDAEDAQGVDQVLCFW